jgi:AraC family transcriptional regulator, regulatory protein of adaptative response / methylated-DNA-[protein]-cysteine methyltransferase
MDSYARMAKIVQFLDEHFQDQPSLEQLAQLTGLSPTHFHREFQRWIGVSPKDFVQ